VALLGLQVSNGPQELEVSPEGAWRYWDYKANKFSVVDISVRPETWAGRAYRNLIYLNEVEKGSYFALWEQPQLFTEGLRAAFSSLH
jgi:hypothetical protein